MADKYGVSSINPLSGKYLQQLLAEELLLGNGATPGNIATGAADTNQLSPFAQLLDALQRLQQSDPAKYKQITAQIAANLLSGAQAAQQQGNSTVAAELKQLAGDFTAASQSGQLPNLQNLAHHHHRAAVTDALANAAGGSS